MSLLQDNNQSIDETRREFLRKSVYAAYATPVIVCLLVAKESAAASFGALKKACEGTPPLGSHVWDSSSKTCINKMNANSFSLISKLGQ